MIIGAGCHAHETVCDMPQLGTIAARHSREAARHGTNTSVDGRLISQTRTADLRIREGMIRQMLLHVMHRWDGVELRWSTILGKSVRWATVVRVRGAPGIWYGSWWCVMTGPIWKHREVRMSIATSICFYMLALQLALNALAIWGVTNERQNWANAFNELNTEPSIWSY